MLIKSWKTTCHKTSINTRFPIKSILSYKWFSSVLIFTGTILAAELFPSFWRLSVFETARLISLEVSLPFSISSKFSTYIKLTISLTACTWLAQKIADKTTEDVFSKSYQSFSKFWSCFPWQYLTIQFDVSNLPIMTWICDYIRHHSNRISTYL